jgi:hypothetical protein
MCCWALANAVLAPPADSSAPTPPVAAEEDELEEAELEVDAILFARMPL